MRVCDEQIREMQKLRGKDYAPTTIIKYKNTVLRLNQFLKYKYKRTDIFLYELNYYFISEFEAFLNTIRQLYWLNSTSVFSDKRTLIEDGTTYYPNGKFNVWRCIFNYSNDWMSNTVKFETLKMQSG